MPPVVNPAPHQSTAALLDVPRGSRDDSSDSDADSIDTDDSASLYHQNGFIDFNRSTALRSVQHIPRAPVSVPQQQPHIATRSRAPQDIGMSQLGSSPPPLSSVDGTAGVPAGVVNKNHSVPRRRTRDDSTDGASTVKIDARRMLQVTRTKANGLAEQNGIDHHPDPLDAVAEVFERWKQWFEERDGLQMLSTDVMKMLGEQVNEELDVAGFMDSGRGEYIPPALTQFLRGVATAAFDAL